MVWLIAAPNQFRLPRISLLPVNSPAFFAVCPATRQVLVGFRQNQTVLKRESQSFGSLGVLRRCRVSESDDYSALEQEVLEFMLQSENPDKFPSRKQLIEGGRGDLAETILKRGGWMTRGWDLVSDDESEEPEFDAAVSKWSSLAVKSEFEVNGVENSEVSSAEVMLPEILEGSSAEMGIVNGSCAPSDSSHPPASSIGRSIENAADRDSGIEGILNRLEKQRNWSLGLDVERKDKTSFSNENGLHTGVLNAADSCYPRIDGEAVSSLENNMVVIRDKMLSSPRRGNNIQAMSKLNGVRNSLNPDTWRTWSIQRAGFSDSDFEAAEIDFGDSGKGRAPVSPTDQIIALKKGNKEEPSEMIVDSNSGGKYSRDKIKSRLQNLEHELSSALYLLRSDTDDLSRKVDHERLLEDSRNLSDNWEFQENEIMKAQDKLRSLRARFAVLEGKVALAKMDTQKVIDEKQKRINDARKALQLLRTICVVWPNCASEVLLTGSFDGWATQRKMEKSSNGTFCLYLRLYPGRYEIKFVVDGSWKVDPLRSIVNNNGNENNLLIIP